MDLDSECQVIHEFSVLNVAFLIYIFFNLNVIHIFLVICHRKFHTPNANMADLSVGPGLVGESEASEASIVLF